MDALTFVVLTLFKPCKEEALLETAKLEKRRFASLPIEE